MPGGAGPYRGVRANMEQPSIRTGLDHCAKSIWDAAGRGRGHRRQRYRRPARCNRLFVIGVRRELPTRFVIPAGGAPSSLVLIARCVPALLRYLNRPPPGRTAPDGFSYRPTVAQDGHLLGLPSRRGRRNRSYASCSPSLPPRYPRRRRGRLATTAASAAPPPACWFQGPGVAPSVVSSGSPYSTYSRPRGLPRSASSRRRALTTASPSGLRSISSW